MEIKQKSMWQTGEQIAEKVFQTVHCIYMYVYGNRVKRRTMCENLIDW